MKKKLLAKNTISSLLAQVVSLICGFVLPRVFLQYFGSEVNGLLSSITQFLGIISFLELGVGAVIQSSLYKPLADSDTVQISKVMASANKFFHKLAAILIVYVVGMVIVYPQFVNQQFDYLYIATLIVTMSISSFAQYYFGISDSLLLTADQRGYIQYNAQTVTVILNTVICTVMIVLGSEVQTVKLVTSVIFFIRPLAIRYYVRKKYNIDYKVEYDKEPIEQKWNGVAQHIAAVVLDGTDTIVLTCFSTLSNVSIYSVYYFIIKGVKNLFLSMTNGIQSLVGELWAKREFTKLKKVFAMAEWSIHTGTTFIFSCTVTLIIPFISVYTYTINDAEYIQPIFAILITIANAMHCLRLPYNIMVLAVGHYRQTQKSYIVAAILNIAISIVMVKAFGLVGVAIGTLVAMTYQTAWLAIYNSKHFIDLKMKNILKQFFVDAITSICVVTISSLFEMGNINYFAWMILAIKVVSVAVVVVIVINTIFYKNILVQIFQKICTK